jgi:hypothetical protein
LRDALGFSAGGSNVSLPLRGSAAFLVDIEPSGRFGFWGVEIEADGARPDPFIVALEFVPSLIPAGLPFSVGFTLPYVVDADSRTPSYGFFVRLFFESAREQEYDREEHP